MGAHFHGYNDHAYHCFRRRKLPVLREEDKPLAEENFIQTHLYFNSSLKLLLNIFTAMASKMTPKNLRMAIIPAGPRIFSMRSRDLRTIKMINRLIRIASRTVVV